MLEMWQDLAPFIIASAVLPLQTVMTLVLVRTSIRSAIAWVAGMTVVRLLQGVIFGVLLEASDFASGSGSPRPVFGTLFIVLALLLFVKALRAVFGAEDEDAPPPQWLARAASMSPLVAFGAGAGFMTLSAKFLVFTLGAIGSIEEAHIGPRLSALSYLLFVLIAQIPAFVLLALGMRSSTRSIAMLDSFNAFLQRRSRAITVFFGLIFGTWFLVKALKQLAII